MTTYPATATTTARDTGGFTARLRRAEAWMDDKGRGAWIAAMVLGFVFFWPAGLALVAYMTVTNRWSKQMFRSSCAARKSRHWAMHAASRPSGNTAFDAYKADTLRRLTRLQDDWRRATSQHMGAGYDPPQGEEWTGGFAANH